MKVSEEAGTLEGLHGKIGGVWINFWKCNFPMTRSVRLSTAGQSVQLVVALGWSVGLL